MDRLRCMEVFLEVVDCGSFSTAAARLNMSRASVSKHIASLEHVLKTRLLHRTTKQAVLTEAGKATLDQCKSVLTSFEDMQGGLLSARNELKGTIRVGAPPIFGTKYLLPVITRFMSNYPQIEVALSLSDPSRDIQASGVDIFVGFNGCGESSLVAENLLGFQQVIVASPEYVKRHGAPLHPNDLVRHSCLINTQKTPNKQWRFSNGASVTVNGSLRSNNGEAIKQAALLGQGISMFPYYFVEDECRNGNLSSLLVDFPPVDLHFSVIHQATRILPAKTKKFLEYIKGWSASAKPPVRPRSGASIAAENGAPAFA